MRQFYFLRHGQTDWNVEGRMQGHTDIPLNETGIAQAIAAAQSCGAHAIDRIVSSPLQRAAVTARHVAERLGVPISFDERLKERCHGAIEKMTREEIEATEASAPDSLFHPDATIGIDGRRLPKNAETYEEVAARALAAVQEALATYKDETILFVAHGAWFRALAHHLNGGQILTSDNAVPYRFTPGRDETWEIIIV